MLSGGSSGKKCTPSTSVSQESTISWPSGGLSTAASSRRPRAEASVASGAKYLAMTSNSPRRFPSTRSTITRALRQELVGPRLVTETVENPVHHLGFLVGEKSMRDIDIFRDRDARRHVAA